jgi:hypothetical protein
MDDFLLLYTHFPADFWCKDTHFPVLEGHLNYFFFANAQFWVAFDDFRLAITNNGTSLVHNLTMLRRRASR